MSKISKTAKAAMDAVERGQRTEKKEMTKEEMIRQIRMNLDAGLSIPSQFTRTLLAEYDALRTLSERTDVTDVFKVEYHAPVTRPLHVGETVVAVLATGESDPAAV